MVGEVPNAEDDDSSLVVDFQSGMNGKPVLRITGLPRFAIGELIGNSAVGSRKDKERKEEEGTNVPRRASGRSTENSGRVALL